jgi:acyl dehydratase
MQTEVQPGTLRHFEVGHTLHFGPLSLSLAEIIAYALVVDPQRIHIDEVYAKESRFGGIIASGLHPYTAFHLRYWIPLVADSFICGMSIEKVTFSSPVYPEQILFGVLSITQTVPRPDKGTVVVSWHWQFQDANGAVLQDVHYTSYHKILS